jgi:hypothetical protein
MQMKIQQTPHVHLLVSAALLEKLIFGSGFEIAPTPPFAFNFWHAGGGGFEFRGAPVAFLRKLLRAFYI